MRRSGARGFALLPVVIGLVLFAAIVLVASRQGASLATGAASLGEEIQVEETFRAARLRANWELDARQCGGYLPRTSTLGGQPYAVAFGAKEGSPVDLTLTATMQTGAKRVRRVLQEKAWDLEQTLVIDSAKSTRLNQNALSINYGNNIRLKVGVVETNQELRSPIQFDLSSIPAGVRIASATLRLNVETVGLANREIGIGRLTQSWVEDEATWNVRSLLVNWTSAGGTVAATDYGKFTVSATGAVSVDITTLVSEWHTGRAPNFGLVLRQTSSPRGDETDITSDDAGINRPRLEIRYQCECGSTCSVDNYASCDSRYRANSLAAVHAPSLGAIEGAAAVPGDFTVAGITFGADGGYVLVDGQVVHGYSSTGVSRGTCNISNNVTGVAYVAAGPDRGKLALMRSIGGGEARIDYVGATCSVERTVRPVTALTHPVGIAYLRLEPGHSREHQLAMINATGLVVFVDAAGAVQGSITPDFAPATVGDLTHVYNQNYLMFVDTARSEVVTMDLTGHVVDRYDYGRFTLQNARGMTVDMNSCAHIIGSQQSNRVAWLVRTPLSLEPVAHWKLDETAGNVAADEVAANHGIVSAGATWQPLDGAMQGSLLLDQPGEGVQLADSELLNLTESLSLTGWIRPRPNAHDAGEPLVARRFLANHHQFWLGLVGGIPTFRFNDGAEQSISGAAPLAVGTWAHLGATYDVNAGTAALFVNGVRVATLPATLPLRATTAVLRLGDDGFDDTRASIDDVRVYKGALTDTDMLTLYQESPATGGGLPPLSPPACDARHYGDDFGSVSFALSTGSMPWTDPWEELGEGDGANAGDVRVQVSPQALQLQDNDNGGEGVRRRVDLSRFTSATLSFEYARYALEADDYITVSIGDGSANGWVELGRIQGPGTDNTSSMLSMSFNLAGHRYPGRYVRFLTYAGMADNEGAYIDNVRISGCYE